MGTIRKTKTTADRPDPKPEVGKPPPDQARCERSSDNAHQNRILISVPFASRHCTATEESEPGWGIPAFLKCKPEILLEILLNDTNGSMFASVGKEQRRALTFRPTIATKNQNAPGTTCRESAILSQDETK